MKIKNIEFLIKDTESRLYKAIDYFNTENADMKYYNEYLKLLGVIIKLKRLKYLQEKADI